MTTAAAGRGSWSRSPSCEPCAQLPAVERLASWDAEQNATSLRVDRTLGFRTVSVATDWQKTLQH